MGGKIRKYIWNIPTAIAVGVTAALIISSCDIASYPVGTEFDILGGLQMSFILEYTAYLVPVAVCFPYAMRFSEEMAGGYGQFAMLRVGRLPYAIRKLGDAMFSSAIVMLLGVFVYTAYVFLYCRHYSMAVTCHDIGFFGDADCPTLYYDWIQAGGGVAVYVVNILFLMTYAMFWSIVGTVVSLFTSNRRAAIVSPFLLKRFLDYAVPDKLFFLMPSNLRMSGWVIEQAYGGLWYGAVYILIAFAVGLLVVLIKLQRSALKM